MSTPNSPRATLRQGIALPIALAAIVVVGALIAGVFFASMQEYRVGRNTLNAQRAHHGAEVGLNAVRSNWNARWVDTIRVGLTKRLPDTTIDGTIVQRRITRVSPTVFWVTSTAMGGGQSLQARSVKRLNALFRVANADFKILGALTLRGADQIGGSTKVSGTDTVPPNWDCPPGGAPGAGLVVSDSSAGNPTITGTTCAAFSCVSGDPAVKDSTEIVKDTMTFTKFGSFTFDSLANRANIVWTAADGTSITMIDPDSTGGVCNIANKKNWGSIQQTNPPGKCDDYYPVVYLKGATTAYTITGDGGQGIILADGDLKLAGNFVWTGIILVRGTINLQGNGGSGGVKVTGAIAAMNRANGTNVITGNSSVTFSRCAINQVTSKLATVAPTKYRAWAELSF